MTLTPSDSGYRPKDHAKMTPEEIYEWCKLRHVYRGNEVECAKLEEEGEDEKKTEKSEIWNTQDEFPFKARTLTREIKGSQKLQVSSFVDKKKTLGKEELPRQ